MDITICTLTLCAHITYHIYIYICHICNFVFVAHQGVRVLPPAPVAVV